MKYAEVSVNSPIARRRTFTYSVPAGLGVRPGHAVWVPFGSKVLQGIVMGLSEYAVVSDTRDIAGLIEPGPMLSPAGIELATWLSGYYLSPLFDAVALMLPPGFERNALTYLARSTKPSEGASLSEDQQAVLHFIQDREKAPVKELEKVFGVHRARTAASQLLRKALIERRYELERVKVKPKTVLFVRSTIPAGETEEAVRELRGARAAKQADFLQFLAGQVEPLPLSAARKTGGAAVDALIGKGLLKVQTVEVRREPVHHGVLTESPGLTLIPAQQSALDALVAGLSQTRQPGAAPGVFLLHGITGSGKTEVYLRVLAEAVKQGKRGIVLVPEISLTPQTIERFAARFPDRVAVLHSELSLGEQFDEWQRIRNGEFDVVIGPRSALFAPQPDLGLIVIDEEHEWTYKQTEKSPRYHAREAAIKLSELTGAVVLLGSATPDVETYYKAQRGEYRLLELGERVAPDAALPPVEIVDLRDELKSGNRGIFSRKLAGSLAETLSRNQQAILFLNRRGAATFIQCRNCGFVLRCKRCQVTMAYHSAGDTLICHQCNHHTAVPAKCPQCASRHISFLGVGIQKVEQEAAAAFPGARVLRWDSDTADGQAHREMMRKLSRHEVDILVGTQMVAKGLDLPLVTTVGVISADVGLNLPDFRAGEKTFQLLCQVAGRAGRSGAGGRAVIQTFAPEHYAVQAAARHDYLAFYNTEIGYRRELGYPPFNRLACLTYVHSNESRCRQEADRLKEVLLGEIAARGLSGINIIGPAPAFISRRRGHYRWQIIVRGTNPPELLSTVDLPQGWTADIDPVSLI